MKKDDNSIWPTEYSVSQYPCCAITSYTVGIMSVGQVAQDMRTYSFADVWR